MNNHKEQTEATYDKIAEQYSSSHFDHFWVSEFKIFSDLIGKRKKVLDIGCGAGRDASVFVEHDYDYTGIDASEGMLRVAAERIPEGRFKKMDFYKLDFSNETFDAFWASASFLHVPKKELSEVLQEAKRIVKKGGFGFISVKERQERDEGMITEDKYGGINRYFAFYTKGEFKELLEKNNFKVVKMTNHLEGDNRKTNWLCFFVMK